MTTTLLYREVRHNGGLVFALEDQAQRIARIHEAIDRARTWGEFHSLVPGETYSQILAAIDANGDPAPLDGDDFSGEQIPGWSDGDYPPWLQQQMSNVVPTDVLEMYGTLNANRR